MSFCILAHSDIDGTLVKQAKASEVTRVPQLGMWASETQGAIRGGNSVSR